MIETQALDPLRPFGFALRAQATRRLRRGRISRTRNCDRFKGWSTRVECQNGSDRNADNLGDATQGGNRVTAHDAEGGVATQGGGSVDRW